MLIIIVGESGVGKDTIADMCVNILRSKAIKIRSYSTREPRYEGENTHIFYPAHDKAHAKKLFDDLVDMENVAAWTCIDGHYYWTLKDQFNHFDYEFYVCDYEGAIQALKNVEGPKIVVEVVRPKELINVDKDRVDREMKVINIPKSMIFINDTKTLQELKYLCWYLCETFKSQYRISRVHEKFRTRADPFTSRIFFE